MKELKSTVKRTGLLASSLLCSALLMAVPFRKELNEGWKFKQARLTNWYPATVPGVIHTDLLANKIIEDPFFRLNERGLQWIDKEDWIYETTFSLPAEIMQKQTIRLIFKGLDTYADVYLNEKKILAANNMFREWQVDIKPYLLPDDNKLKVYFHSPIKMDIPKWDALPYHYEASNDQSENGGVFDKKVSVFARKAGYHYGWDWGPRLVTSGIWRPVFIEAWDDAHIHNIFIRQKEVNKNRAIITGEVEIEADSSTKPLSPLRIINPVKCWDNKDYLSKKGSTKQPFLSSSKTRSFGGATDWESRTVMTSGQTYLSTNDLQTAKQRK